ncbi:MAG: DUF4345 domain-containing protein [Planctomycetota bacterium]
MPKTSRSIRFLLTACGLIAIGIGASILVTPVQFHAMHEIKLEASASLLSEVRAPGGALAALGVVMLWGAFVGAFVVPSLLIAAAVYLSYGISRLVSLALDGVPHAGLVAAAALELVLGFVCAVVFARRVKRVGPATLPAFCHPRSGEGPEPQGATVHA